MAEAGLSQEKKKLFSLLVLLIGAGLLLLINPKNNTTGEKLFKTDYALESPDIKEKKVADFYFWTKEDPLFTSPDFKSDNFYESVVALRNEESAYLKLINRKEKLFPTDFLLSLRNVDRAEKDFLKKPSFEKGEALISYYKTTLNYYQKDINDLLAQVEKINLNKFNGTNIILLNSVITADIAKNDLQKLKENSINLREEVSSRENCLKNGFGCKRPVSEFSSFKINTSGYSFLENSALPKEAVSPFPEFLSNGDWSGPYAVLTPCVGLSDRLQAVPHLYYVVKMTRPRIYQEEPRNQVELHVKLAETNYYVGVDENGNEIGNNPTNYESRRILLESNVYDCPSSDFKATLTSIDNLYKNNDSHFFKKLLNQKKIDSNLKSFFEKGEELENLFYNENYPSDIRAGNLANYYALLYKKTIEWKDDPEFKNSSLVNDLFKKRYDYLNIYLDYKRKMGDIDEMLTQSKNNFSSFRATWIVKGSKDYGDGLSYLLYVVRSMYGLTYIPFSESVYRFSEQPKYAENKKIKFITGLDKRYIDYHEASRYYSPEVINSWAYDTSLELESEYRDFLFSHPNFKN